MIITSSKSEWDEALAYVNGVEAELLRRGWYVSEIDHVAYTIRLAKTTPLDLAEVEDMMAKLGVLTAEAGG